MCNPKPYPRCASHALQQLERAEKKYNEKPTDDNEMAWAEALDNFNATDAGMKKIRESDDKDKLDRLEKYEKLRELRKAEARDLQRIERNVKAREERKRKKLQAEEEERERNSPEGKARTAWDKARERRAQAWEAYESEPDNSVAQAAAKRAAADEVAAFKYLMEIRERRANTEGYASNPDSDKKFTVDPTPLIEKLRVVSNPDAGNETLERYASDADPDVREKVASHRNASPEVLDTYADEPNHKVLRAMVMNANVRLATLRKAFDNASPAIRLLIVNTKAWVAATRAGEDLTGRVKGTVTEQKKYASDSRTPAKLQLILSTSSDVDVVREVALNRALTKTLAHRLLRHPDESVRKITATHPVLSKAK